MDGGRGVNRLTEAWVNIRSTIDAVPTEYGRASALHHLQLSMENEAGGGFAGGGGRRCRPSAALLPCCLQCCRGGSFDARRIATGMKLPARLPAS